MANSCTNCMPLRSRSILPMALFVLCASATGFAEDLGGAADSKASGNSETVVLGSSRPPTAEGQTVQDVHIQPRERIGAWNEQRDTLDFTIAPAWWQTNWFRVSCEAALAFLLYTVHRLRVARIARQFNARLEARVHERTRVARELHDRLLQSFQSLLPRLQAVAQLLPGNVPEAKALLLGTIERASDAIHESREAVHDLRDSATEANDLASSIRALGEALADEHGGPQIALGVEVQGRPRDLHPILRDEIFRIAGEALRNAFRHAGATKVEVEIRYDERRLQMRVRDDGRGMDPDILLREGPGGHFGLRGMRERAKIIGGTLDVWSAEGNGTEVDLVIPASNAYSAPQAPIRETIAQKARNP